MQSCGKHGQFAEQFLVSAYDWSTENLKDLKNLDEIEKNGCLRASPGHCFVRSARLRSLRSSSSCRCQLQLASAAHTVTSSGVSAPDCLKISDTRKRFLENW